MPFLEVLSWNSKMTLKVRLMTPILYTSQENPMMHIWCKFGDSSSNPLEIIMWTNQISYNSEPEWPCRWNSMTPIFNLRWQYPTMHVWCKFGYPSSNLLCVIVWTSKVYAWIGQMQTMTISFWPRSQGVKTWPSMNLCILLGEYCVLHPDYVLKKHHHQVIFTVAVQI